MNKDDFNKLAIESQVSEINLLIKRLGSLRKAVEDIGIAKSTIQSRFGKSGYVLENDQYVLKSVVVEIVPESGKNNSPDYNSLNDCISTIHIKLNSIARSFIEIGTMLIHIQDSLIFKQKGYSNLLSFTESEFGLSKTQTYNLIAVSKKFSIDGTLKDEYKEFKFSQLVEMISLSDEKLDLVSSNMEVKEIRAVKKSTPKVKDNSNEVFENIDIAKNQIAVEDVLQQEDNSSTLFDINSKEFLISNNLYVLTDRQVKILLDLQGSMYSDYLNSYKDWNDKKKDSIFKEICDIRKILEREDQDPLS